MASTSFHGIRGETLTGCFRETNITRWLKINALTESGDGAAVYWHGVRPEDVLRLASDLLQSAIDAEDVPSLIWGHPDLADWEGRDTNALHNEVNRWASEQCTGDGEHKLTALAWLALDEQQRCDACERWWPEGY